MKRVMALLVIVLCVSVAAQAGTSVIHYWDFEGVDDTERLQDKVGDLDLSHEDDTLAGTAVLDAGTLAVSSAGYGVEAKNFTVGEDLNFGTDSFSYSFDVMDIENGDSRQVRVVNATGTYGVNFLTDYNKSYSTVKAGSNDAKDAYWISPYEEDVWHSVVVNVDRSGDLSVVEVYIDGVLAPNINTTATTLDAIEAVYCEKFQLGYSGGGGTTGATQPGEIDNFAFYDGLLSADQIAGLADGSIMPNMIPEPATMVLLGLGGLMLRRRK